jgi:hypothetical protein
MQSLGKRKTRLTQVVKNGRINIATMTAPAPKRAKGEIWTTEWYGMGVSSWVLSTARLN